MLVRRVMSALTAPVRTAVHIVRDQCRQRCTVHRFVDQLHSVPVCNALAVAARAALAIGDAVACNVQCFSRQRVNNLTVDVVYLHLTTPY